MDGRRHIEEKIAELVATDPRNALPENPDVRIYDAPLLGVAAADDGCFIEFQKPEIVGAHFMLPEGWLPGAKSVISYFLPFTKEIRKSNRGPGMPSAEWIAARIDGETFNGVVRAYLVELIRALGAQAVSPGLDPRHKVEDRVSNWSERHVAYAAGLGTFGLHRALITQKGSAGRFGSVITTLPLAPTRRAYTSYYEYCLYLTRGTCGACMKRCPPHAITRAGKDHSVCNDYLAEILPQYAPRSACAKCNCGVPCEERIPAIK